MILRKKGGTATKRDPKKWADAKSRAKRKMGGKVRGYGKAMRGY